MFILTSSCFLCNSQYATGITVITSNIEINVPKKIIAAIPDHMGPPEIIIGKTPIGQIYLHGKLIASGNC
jgi:hypothetical protein